MSRTPLKRRVRVFLVFGVLLWIIAIVVIFQFFSQRDSIVGRWLPPETRTYDFFSDPYEADEIVFYQDGRVDVLGVTFVFDGPEKRWIPMEGSIYLDEHAQFRGPYAEFDNEHTAELEALIMEGLTEIEGKAYLIGKDVYYVVNDELYLERHYHDPWRRKRVPWWDTVRGWFVVE